MNDTSPGLKDLGERRREVIRLDVRDKTREHSGRVPYLIVQKVLYEIGTESVEGI